MHVFDEWASRCVATGNSNTFNPDELYKNAREYFEHLSSSQSSNDENDEVSDIGLKRMKKSVSTNIALLVSKMDEALSSKLNNPKLKALSCLRGALDGIENFGIPIQMTALLRNFFLAYCGPMQPIEILVEQSQIPEDCTVDEMRDAALRCIICLIQSRFFTEDDKADTNSSIQLRISIMKEGIQKRCSSDEYDDDDGIEDYYSQDVSSKNEQSKILSNLSLLPRTKRSLCFSVLEAALRGISIDVGDNYDQKVDPLIVKTFHDIFAFVDFACSCLHGEIRIGTLIRVLLPLIYNINLFYYSTLSQEKLTHVAYYKCSIY